MPDNNDAVILRKNGEALSRPHLDFSSWNGICAERSGFKYTVHMNKDAISLLSKGSGLFFTCLNKALVEIVGEEVGPLVDSVSSYCSAELNVIQGVSAQSSNGQVKVSGTIPLPPTDIQTDAGFQFPRGSWNPPAAVNQLAFWTVNSLSLAIGTQWSNQWQFTATNTGAPASTKTIVFGIQPKGDSFALAPQDFRTTYGFTDISGWSQFRDGLDTCYFDTTNRSWVVFKDGWCSVVNADKTKSQQPNPVWVQFPALAPLINGDYGDAEKAQWASTISCATVDGNGNQWFISGRRVVRINSARTTILEGPKDIAEVWPYLSEDSLNSVNIGNKIPAAICYVPDTKPFGFGKGNAWLFIFENIAICKLSGAKGANGNWFCCPMNSGNADFGWQAMAAYTELYSPWSWPRCS